MTKSGWKTHHFGTTLKGGNFFHLALLRHQNIKTSLNFLEENHWARPFFALFSSFREKLQLTVSLNHPVSSSSPSPDYPSLSSSSPSSDCPLRNGGLVTRPRLRKVARHSLNLHLPPKKLKKSAPGSRSLKRSMIC